MKKLAILSLVFVIFINCKHKEPKPIKVGILHSLTGTMAISEVSLKDVLLMGIDEINLNGGILGRQLEPIVVDPASNWDVYAKKSEQLLVDDKVDVTFGCWTSISRKAVKPIFEKYNGLLFYPVQYEGLEESPNIIYTGATPNQQLIPAAEYLLSKAGGEYEKFYLLGTDYIFPRTANKILKEFLISKGVSNENIVEKYTDFHHQNYEAYVAEIKEFSKNGNACVLSTINGDSNLFFYKEFAKQGLTAEKCPIMAFSIAENELRVMDTEHLVGHYATWNYFQSLNTPENKRFVESFKKYCKENNPKEGKDCVTDDPMNWSYVGLQLYKKAVEKVKTTDVQKVIEALQGLQIESTDGIVKMHSSNHHLAKPVMIGKIKKDGQFDIIYKTSKLISPEPFKEY